MKDSMMLISSEYQEKQTLELIPFSNNSVYIKGIIEPSSKYLVLISKEKKEEFHMLPRLNADGDPEMKSGKGGKENPNPYKQQRVAVNLNLEYFIIDPKEIENFIELVCYNSDKIDYKSFLEKEEEVKEKEVLEEK